ncbi:MAG: hypothetical protein QOI83_3144 [Streptomycetaceae bacterium]|nr:hypothetical protein [Streptomycetaceae bacterium]
MRVRSVGRQWSRFVAGGRPLVGLDPLVPCAPREVVEIYVAATAVADRLRLGVSRKVL